MTILTALKGPEEWRHLLASETHWREGCSAHALAHSWHASDGFPTEISSILKTHPNLSRATRLLAIPEHRVALEGRGRASQTDLWVLARIEQGLMSIAVEGKVSESFGETVTQWLEGASDGKRTRLEELRKLLRLPEPVPGGLRYQLLHRTASALLEAVRFHASYAVMLVHSFSSENEGYADFEAFVAALGASPRMDQLIAIPGHVSPTLYVGWVRGAARS